MAALVMAVVSLVAALGVGAQERSPRVRAAAATSTPSQPAPGGLPGRVPSDRGQLVAGLNRAQALIDSPSSSEGDVEAAGRFQQLATYVLVRAPAGPQRAVLGRLTPVARASMRADLAAAAALRRLNLPRRNLPPWKVISPPPPGTLLGYFKAAQARFGVPWQYLAAIEFVETKFGRVAGLSTAGAEGPMQFLPATWAQYGRGDVHNSRDAIFGAARYLVASGAPGDMAGALYHYNPSGDYVAAITAYARRMRADRRAYYGYYHWQVIYAKLSGAVILPVGYPTVRPVPLASVTNRDSAG